MIDCLINPQTLCKPARTRHTTVTIDCDCDTGTMQFCIVETENVVRKRKTVISVVRLIFLMKFVELLARMHTRIQCLIIHTQKYRLRYSDLPYLQILVALENVRFP